MRKIYYTMLLTALCGTQLYAQQPAAKPAEGYRHPPKVMEDMLLASPAPAISINDDGTYMVLAGRTLYPTLAELAQPELRIAGMRMNPANYALSRQTYYNSIAIKNIKTGKVSTPAGLPAQLRASELRWNAAGNKVAFLNTTPTGVNLYVVDVMANTAKKVNKAYINNVLEVGARWQGNNTLVYPVAVKPVSAAPPAQGIPQGPAIQQSSGKSAPSATYQDLIRNKRDEDLFEFYATAQLVSNTNGVETKLGSPQLYQSVSTSPDGSYMLAEIITKPFSYLVGYRGFPSRVVVLNARGQQVKELAVLPSSEIRPAGYDNIQNVPRGFSWRSDEPATVVWSRPLDSGLIKKDVPYHDAVYALKAPFNGNAQELFKTQDRYRGTIWGNDKIAWVSQGLTSKQTYKYALYNSTAGTLTTVFSGNTTDAYNEPGSPVLVRNKYNRNVIAYLKDGHSILMNNSTGASPKGDLPFIAKFNTDTKKSDIIWRSNEQVYTTVTDVIDPEKLLVIIRRESKTMAPNYLIGNLGQNNFKPLTDNKDPYPQLQGVTKQKVAYKRADGIDLTGTLYLPKGFTPGSSKPLPTLIWAYPREFNAAQDAAQVRGSDNRFTSISWASPIYWVTQGYAVLDNAEMPITGSQGRRPNDTFVQQLEMNAKAAINKLAAMHVTDTARVAVGGHSYGAFMTANLLAHTNLFAAGIARSGAYNRTLTPFGFQNEDRTYWQAPDLYYKMSPFSYADKIKRPLLLIHGEMDDNPGTFPINSERLFNAIKGTGGTVRLVYLPYEAHSYRAQENLLHMLWEQNEWLNKYLKNK